MMIIHFRQAVTSYSVCVGLSYFTNDFF